MPKTIFSTGQEIFQQLLKKVRVEQGVTQMQLAKRLRVPQSFVSKAESGERRIDLIELQLICSALKMPLSEFIRRFEDEMG